MKHLDSTLAGSGPGPQARSYPRFPQRIPTGTFEHRRFAARFARSPSELDEILRLRFEVFNVELAEGLDRSWRAGRDEDEYDLACHHLLVEDRERQRIVGTYRLQTSIMAAAGRGFYSAGEFELSHLPDEVLADAVEIGRACIAADCRNRFVLFLLWQGLARYLTSHGKRFFFGCCSLAGQDPAVGWRLHCQLLAEGRVHPQLNVEPLHELAAPRPSDATLAGIDRVEVPTLFRTYLRYGALVCSPPAIDRQFKTIDYLVLFDRENMLPRAKEFFFGEAEPEDS